MYLKSLTLKGFKSFADKTKLTFDPGLTVVVGPNGSGKSNVSDAVLWVLGEQSAKMLRGQAMEDVIFAGSSARKPVGLAEVTLVLDNEDRTLPIDFSEVGITRRMYRSGESEYLINGAPARLMDIQDILHDSGLGKDTHSIISQGKLDSVLSSKPEERRSLVEEAAGISKHRRRKERSARKLKSMDENLKRAKDIQREVRRQLRPLERQVDKARQAHDVQEQLGDLRRILAVDDLRQLNGRYKRITSKSKQAEAAIELARYRVDERSRDLERYQSMLEQKGLFVGDLDEQRRRMQDLLGRMDSDMRLLEEKGKNMVSRLSEMRMRLSTADKRMADARRDHESVDRELAEARAQTDELERRVGELAPAAKDASERRRELGRQVASANARLQQAQRDADRETLAFAKLQDQISNAELEDQMFESRLSQIDEQLSTADEAIEQLTSRKSELEGSLAAARERATATEEAGRVAKSELSRLQGEERVARERLSEAQATLAALRGVDEQAENSSELVAELARGSGDAEVACRLADLVEAPPEDEPVVEAVLGSALAALVAEDEAHVRTVVERAEGLSGRGTATIVNQREPRGARGDDGEDVPGRRLLDGLVVTGGTEGLIDALLGDVYVVDDAKAALAAHAASPAHTYVTPDATMVFSDGRCVVGASGGDAQGALERKRRMRDLRDGMGALDEGVASAKAAVASAEEAVATAREELSEAKGEIARLSGELSSASSELGRLGSQRDGASSERKQLAKRRTEAAEKIEDARQGIKRHRTAADEAKEQVRKLSSEVEGLGRQRSSASREEDAAQGKLSSAKLELATVSERRNHLSVREEELRRTIADLERTRAATAESARALDVVRLRVEPLHVRYDAIRERATAWASRLKDRASLEEADSDSLKKTIRTARDAVSEAQGELERATASAAELKVDLGKIEVQVEAAIEAITKDGSVLDEALKLPAPDDREAAERRVEQLERQLTKIGPVNEVAMEEYARLKERADYIEEQVGDLEGASRALSKIMAAIDRKMRKQFLVVFDKVNVNFEQVFSMLFPGGHAHLEMTDPDHPFETGIEIQAQPHGKRIRKMTLMSGGEKSLTALALLFAVYRTRTVPFYIFDEVEAALDDSNLSKLLGAIAQLKETTQLIVISHQRRTMEQADVLYGVSMQADGVSHVVSQRLDEAVLSAEE